MDDAEMRENKRKPKSFIINETEIDEDHANVEPEKSKTEVTITNMEVDPEAPTSNDVMDVGVALCDHHAVGDMTGWTRERLLGRMAVARAVPGLEGSALLPPRVGETRVTQLYMVQITTSGGGAVTSGKTTTGRHLVVVGTNSTQTMAATTSSPTFLLRPGPSGVTVAGTCAIPPLVCAWRARVYNPHMNQ